MLFGLTYPVVIAGAVTLVVSIAMVIAIVLRANRIERELES